MAAGAEQVLVAWSGGKDSLLALEAVRAQPGIAVASLLTTFSEAHDRVSMHGVRRPLLEAQTEALGLPLREVLVAAPAADPDSFTAFPLNEEYERKMGAALLHFRERGVRRVVYGDIFLEDLREYRERTLARLGLAGLYPLWLGFERRGDSRELVEEFIGRGFRAVTVCADARVLDASWAGRLLDRRFLEELPPGIDPCGENGEFHTFVFDGPSFRRPVRFVRGEAVRRGSFWFCDLLPG